MSQQCCLYAVLFPPFSLVLCNDLQFSIQRFPIFALIHPSVHRFTFPGEHLPTSPYPQPSRSPQLWPITVLAAVPLETKTTPQHNPTALDGVRGRTLVMELMNILPHCGPSAFELTMKPQHLNAVLAANSHFQSPSRIQTGTPKTTSPTSSPNAIPMSLKMREGRASSIKRYVPLPSLSFAFPILSATPPTTGLATRTRTTQPRTFPHELPLRGA